MSEATGVLLRGLPFEADQDDIKQFFSSLAIPHSSVEMIVTYDGKVSGLAFVQLCSSDEVKMALLMDRNHMGGRYIDVMTVTEEKLDQLKKAASNGLGRRELHRMCGDNNRPVVARGASNHGARGSLDRSDGRRSLMGARERSRSPIRDSDDNRFAYFKGFPDDVLYKGVRSFFEDCAIGKACVHLFRGENGKFRGDGFVEFLDPSQLRKGLKRDGSTFRNRKINVEVCSQEEVYDNLRFMMDRTGPNIAPDPLYGGYRRREERDYGRSSGDRRSSREDYRGYGGRHEDCSSVEYHPSYSHYEEGKRHEIDYAHSRYDAHDGHRGYRHADNEGYSSHRRTSSNESKTLRMQGIHPSARVSDIVSFFKNYGIEYDGVRIQCHDDGTPNGRAFVTFPSERLMSAAYHDMNRRLMKNSYIELSPI